MTPKGRRKSQGSSFFSGMAPTIPRAYRKTLFLGAVLFCLVLVYEIFAPGGWVHAVRYKDVPVIVVEEHHEVLPHWFGAANSGIIPKGGNTLIHIDGHSDMAPTMYFEGYPEFRWPNDDKEITYMMQTNDAFIMAASTSGMFDKVIWVWPKWDSVNHDSSSSEANWEFGFHEAVQENGKKNKVFCECMGNPENPENAEETKCTYMDRNSIDPENMDGTEIARSQCDIRKTVEVVESLETDFLTALSDSLLEPGDNVVLDIDEDYFGCESGVTVMLNHGISWKVLEQLNAFLSLTICTKTTEQETEGDKLLTGLIKIIIKKCKGKENCVEKDILKLAAFYIDKHRKEKNSKIFCRGRKGTSYFTKLITRRLINMTKDQLKLLINVGFCSTSTPKTYRGPDAGDDIFRVCHGVNTPNETIVITHSPDQNEMNMRMNLLDQIIQHTDFPKPKLVTVCRSMRDAYTPKSWFHEIEKGVLDTLRRKLGESMALTYDIDLLGGRSGWPGRHDMWLEKL